METQNQVDPEPSFWVQPPEKRDSEPMWPRNLVIVVFIAFIAGLMLGKIMHPTLLNLKH